MRMNGLLKKISYVCYVKYTFYCIAEYDLDYMQCHISSLFPFKKASAFLRTLNIV